jgi:hypothetical protein
MEIGLLLSTTDSHRTMRQCVNTVLLPLTYGLPNNGYPLTNLMIED